MVRFVSFGSGSSGNCYYLYTETDGLLIDAGIGYRTLRKGFNECGLSLSSIHNIIITHEHADHVKAVGKVSEECGAPVYATATVHTGIERNCCVHTKISGSLVRTIHKGKTVGIGGFNVTPFDVPHDSLDNVGYSIECGGVTFCLVTDAGTVTNEIKRHIRAADYLVIEANHDVTMVEQGRYPRFLKERILSDRGHLSNDACGRTIAQCATYRLKGVWLCHLSGENNDPDTARGTVEEILLDAGIMSAFNFRLDVLRRRTLEGPYELK